MPLLYLQLERHASDLVPAEKLSDLKHATSKTQHATQSSPPSYAASSRLFAESGIEAIPYKGPVLALFAYDNLALRRFVDLDVIVNKNDVLKAREILLTAATRRQSLFRSASRSCCYAHNTTCNSRVTIIA